jgi:CRISPR-associated protein Cas1
MGDLLVRAASQQALLDAWSTVHQRLTADGAEPATVRRFERTAAKAIAELSTALLAGRWRPARVQPIDIDKPSGGRRRLAVSTIPDRIVERAVLEVLDEVVDPVLLPWSFAFRRGLGVDDAIRAVLDQRDDGGGWVARGDFRDCFARIPRAGVIERLAQVVDDPALIEVVRLLVYRPELGAGGSAALGLHQGSALSPILANLFLDRFDRDMLARGWRVVRFADDWSVVVDDQSMGERALDAAVQVATSLRLELTPAKCSVRSFAEGVPFLGQVLTEGTGSRSDRRHHPKATTVFVTEQGSLVRSRGERLKVVKGDDVLLAVPYRKVRELVVCGRVGLTTPLLEQALTRGIDVVLLSETGRYIGRIHGESSGNAFVRRDQYRAADDPEVRLDLARRFVRGKVSNMRSGVLRHTRRGARAAGPGDLVRVADRLERARGRVDEMTSIDELMGLEGSATREYFQAVGFLAGERWGFTARRRRPPPDPVNSMLSFGYTLLMQEVHGALESAGLDPYAGFLHATRSGSPALAFDLVEEFRPVLVDAVVLRLARSPALDASSFVLDDGPPVSCRMTAPTRKAFLAAYERRMLTLVTHHGSGRRVSWRVCLALQARALAAEVSGSDGRYVPVVWK